MTIRIARDHCLAPQRVDAPIYGGRYRRLVGIVNADPESFRTAQSDWTPTLPAHVPNGFGLLGILVPVAEG